MIMANLRIILLASVLVQSCSTLLVNPQTDTVDIAITKDLELQKQARSSPHYDGNVFMDIVDMVPKIVETTLEGYYDKDEVERRAERHLFRIFTMKYFRLVCSMKGCQHGGKCLDRETRDALTNTEQMDLHEKWKLPLPENVAKTFPASDERFVSMKEKVIDELWKGNDPGLNWFLVSGQMSSGVADIINLPDDPVNQRHAENMLESIRQTTWRHLVDLSIAVLNKIAHAANDPDEVTKIADKYVRCECILGFTGKHCDTCPIYKSSMNQHSTHNVPKLEEILPNTELLESGIWP